MTFTKLYVSVDIVELGIEKTYDSFLLSDELNFSMANETITAIGNIESHKIWIDDILFKSNYFLVNTEECSERIIPGYLNQSNPYCDKISELFSFIIIKLNLMPTFFYRTQ